jgi:hypothetical protein
MPPEALSLALAASIYPPALAAVIALGRGSDVRLRVLLLVAAAYITVLVTGALILFLFTETGLTSKQARTPSAALYVLGGVVLLWLATRLRRPPTRAAGPSGVPSRSARYLGSRRLVVLLGVILYVVPSPIYLGALKAIADTHAAAVQQLSYLLLTLVVMLWIIELPALLVIVYPARGARVLERVNAWFAQHWRALATAAALGTGAYLIVVGLMELG